jgi:parallel beta helix pectate lyase-like protein
MQRKYISVCCLLFVFSCCSLEPVQGRTIHVSKGGDGTTGNMRETAFKTINSALVASVTKDEIRVTAEAYTDNLDVATPVSILGGFTSVEGEDCLLPTSWTTICPAGEGWVVELLADSMLERFIVTGGHGIAGSGVSVSKSTSLIRNCQIDGNFSSYEGGGITSYKASVTIQGCTISNNTAQMVGGGVSCIQAEVVLRDSVIFGNLCLGTPGSSELGLPPRPGEGGGLYLNDAQATLVNCLLYENEAESGTDIFYRDEGSISCSNCTFASTAYSNCFKRPFEPTSGPSRFSNCICWGHATPFHGDDWIVTYCDVRGGFDGAGNIGEDPLFVNASGGDFHLQANSPCIDSASVTGPSTDLDGNARPLDVPGIGRDGSGDEFDMGAYEFVPGPTPAPTMVNPRSDIDGSTKVDSSDVLILLADWQKSATAAIE